MLPSKGYYFILFGVSILLYLNSLDCGFVFDDASAIKDNMDLRPQTPVWELFQNDFWGTPMIQERSHKSYRPLTVLTFRWNYSLHELNPAGYHLLNILFHAVVVLLFFRFASCFLEEKIAFFAALLFSCHPIHTEAVTGVVGRAELLSAICFLLALMCFRRASKHATHMGMPEIFFLILTELSVMVGTLCKEQCITAIGVCVFMDVFCTLKLNFWRGLDLLKVLLHKTSSSPIAQSKRNMATEKVYYCFIRIAFLVVCTALLMFARIQVMGAQLPVFTNFDNPASVAPFPARQLTFNYLLPVNAWLLLCPSGLCCDWTMGTIPLLQSPLDSRNVFTILFYVIFGYFIYRLLFDTLKENNLKVLSLSLALMVLPFLPASNLFFPVGFVVAERILYTPSMGFCLLMAYGLQQLLANSSPKHNRWVYFFIGILLSSFAVKTYVRNFDWKSEYSLFMSALKVNKLNAKNWNNVGHSLEGEGRFDEALPFFQEAVKVQPDDIGAIINVGRTFNNLNRTLEAEDAYKRALEWFPKPKNGSSYSTRLSPTYLKVFINLSNLLVKNNSRLLEADQYLRRAISMRADYVEAYQNRGDILLRLGKAPEALEQYEIALQYQPRNPDLNFNKGVVLLGMQKKQEAYESFHRALTFDPNHRQSLYNAASLLSETRDIASREEARRLYEIMLDRGYELAQVHFSLAMMDTDEKNFKNAEKHYIQALQVDPSFKSALFNLALLYQNELKDSKAAKKTLVELLKFHPNHLKGHLLMGDIQLNYFKNPQLAHKHFEVAVEIDPTNHQAKHNTCVTLTEFGRLVEAEICLQEALRLAPGEKYIQDHLTILRKRIEQQAKP